MFGNTPVGPKCPIYTNIGMSLQEAAGECLPELRAYKLGKKRWSYNQVEFIVCEEGGEKALTVKQASQAGSTTSGDDNGNGVCYEILLSNDEKLFVDTFLVYDCSKAVPSSDRRKLHEWTLVDRCACSRGCSGPVLRPIQRYGKLGKRSWGGSPSPDVTDRTKHNMKDPRYMYLSFDEAGTHVGFKYFRIVTAVYDSTGSKRLSTAVSPPVRVLANNDVPTGAAHLQIVASLPADWEGWSSAPAPMGALECQFEAVAGGNPSSQTSLTTSDAEGANTPLRFPASAIAPSSYRTRRSTAVKEEPQEYQQPPSPRQCLSTGNAPSSLLVDGTMNRMTPGVEVASPPLERCGGSLSLWLDNDQQQQAGPAPSVHRAPVTAHVSIPSREMLQKRARVIGAMTSAEPLPHSVDFEPNFPSLVGPSATTGRSHQTNISAAVAAVAAAAVQNGAGAHNNNSDDPIAAFVELMMQNHAEATECPIVELPGVIGVSHPGAHQPEYQQQHQIHSEPLRIKHETIIGGCNLPPSPVHRSSMMHNLPGTPPSIATPTPTALDELFGANYANFESFMGDDATFPPVKLPTSPFASTGNMATVN